MFPGRRRVVERSPVDVIDRIVGQRRNATVELEQQRGDVQLLTIPAGHGAQRAACRSPRARAADVIVSRGADRVASSTWTPGTTARRAKSEALLLPPASNVGGVSRRAHRCPRVRSPSERVWWSPGSRRTPFRSSRPRTEQARLWSVEHALGRRVRPGARRLPAARARGRAGDGRPPRTRHRGRRSCAVRACSAAALRC